MLSIGRLGAGQEGYYLNAVAKGIDEYYTVRGEVPGRWTGSGITGLGVSGPVESDTLRALLAGEHPATHEQLASSSRKVCAFDLTFSAPKSVSVVFAFGGWEVARETARAHEAAVDAALGYLQRHGLTTRRGHGGVFRVETNGFVGAAFRHRTSRAGDPQLHTHVLAANLVQGRDGRWGTLDSRGLYRHAKTAGFLYQAHLRAELVARLGVAWGPTIKGCGEIEGVPEAVVGECSQRRAEIQEFLNDMGETTSRGAAQLATLATRDPKTPGRDFDDLRQGWIDRGAALGFTADHIAGCLDREPDRYWDRRGGRGLGEELTWEHSSFDRRDVLRAVAGRAPQGRRVDDIERMADEFLSGPEVITLRTGRWTTPEMLRIEAGLVANALARRAAGAGFAGSGPLNDALDADSELSDEQVRMVRRVTTSGDGIEVVIGVAGSGKTRGLATATRAWRNAGYRVIGTAVAARTARQLGVTTGAVPFTLSWLIHDLDRHGSSQLTDAVVLVDEAAMVGTRQLARLLAHAHRAHAKVVLAGDAAQLPEIEAGGAFAALARSLPANELAENRRQSDPAERDALAYLRAGEAEHAVTRLAYAGRIAISDTPADARALMVDDWLSLHEMGRDVVMLACRRHDVAQLNALARAALVDRGDVAADGITINGASFGVGDSVMTLRNRSELEITNGTIGTVVAIDLDTHQLTIRDETQATTVLPGEYVRDGNVTHAYATTIHKAQGLTADTAVVLADGSLFREAAYTALSRGRTRNQLYVVGPDLTGREDAHAPEVDERDPFGALVASLGHSEAKELALRSVRRTSETPARDVAQDTGIDLGW